MTIPTRKEPDELENDLLERCYFCKSSTRYWHENTNNPVCPKCAKLHKVAELPDHGRIFRNMKRRKKA